MYEVKANIRTIDDVNVETFSRDIYNHNVLTVEAGATKASEDKWGVKTYIKIKDNGCTNMKVSSDQAKGEVEIIMQGHAELETMIEGLEFILKALKDAKNEIV